MPELTHWLMWKEKCALAKCPPAMQSVLMSFVHNRFCRYVTQYAVAFGGAVSPTQQDSWHWFETYFQLHSTRAGKSYKEWLFARGAEGLVMAAEDVESGVSLILRDVVREYLRHEHSPRRVLSLDAGERPDSEQAGLSLKELLPDDFDTANEVERREMLRIAASLAESVFDVLSYRERIVLVGRVLGISLASAGILKFTGCCKSVLAAAHRAALTRIASCVSTAYPDECSATKAALTVEVFNVVKRRIISWARVEKSLSEFLNTVEVTAQEAFRGGMSRELTHELG
ncbi:MAG: hypothetical protein WCN95_01515 [bacterium]